MKPVSRFCLLLLCTYSLIPISLCSTFSLGGDWQPSGYNGTFQLQTPEVTITLQLQQDAYDQVRGNMRSSNGTEYSLEGMVMEGVAAGTCRGVEGYLFFEAYLDGNELTLSLIQPDAYNMPDYDSAQYLLLNRTTPGESNPANAQVRKKTEIQTQQDAKTISPAATPAGKSIVKDEINGFQFYKPDGWEHQQGDGQILLGSHTIAGLISVFPHQARNMNELNSLIQQGIQEEGVYLNLDGPPEQQSTTQLTGSCSGYVQGEQAKGYVIGLLGPHGGGIFILAVSTPDKLGQDIIGAARSISEHTSFTRVTAGSQDLVRHFAGEWVWTSGHRTEWMHLFPNGAYSDQSEASYSGNFTDDVGNITGNWGAYGEQKNIGRWNVQGTRDSGVLTVIDPDGSQTRYEYRVFVERGQKYYTEYLFNGYHYMKRKGY